MPFIKISGLTTATAVSATNQFEINQNGGSRSATVAQVAAFARTSATDPVVLPAGTVSAPALTFTGDTNTGIYSPGADTIAFSEGGVESMRIDGNGNVGVGTSFPARRFEVVAASSNIPARLGNALGNMDIGGSNGTTVDIDTRNWAMGLQTGGLERMRIDTSGNVGIGTSSPASYAGANDRVLTVFNADQNITLGARYQIGVGQLAFINSGNTNNTGPTNLALMTGGVERMFITAAGLVGIGTSSPGANLDVAASGTVSAGNVVRVFNSTDGAGAGALGIVKFGSTAAPYGAYAANNVGVNSAFTNLLFGTETAHNAIFYTSNVERMRVAAGGNVGIGTSNPQDALHVTRTTDMGLRLEATSGATYLSCINTSGAIINNVSNTPMVFTTNNTERMRVDQSGSVGIGTSSPNAAFRLDVSGIGRFTGGAVINGGNALQLVESSGNNSWYFNNNVNNLTFTYNATERMRIDGSGNVGIGTSSPAARLDVNSQIMAGGSAGSGKYLARNSNGITIMDLGIGTGTGFGDSIGLFNQTNTGLLSLGTNGTDRLRIDRDGNVMIGKLSVNYRLPGLQYEIGNYSLVVSTNNTDCIAVNRETADGTTLACYRAGSFVGGISVTTTNTSFNTSSDYRLKENVAPLTGAAARVQALKPSRFNFIADPDRTVDGFIAHEAAEVVPEAVTGQKDAVNEDGSIKAQGIDHSKLVPLLTAALQEALAEITSLKARVAILENK